MSDPVRDGIEQSRRLLRSTTGGGAYPTEAPTELYATLDERDEGTSWVAQMAPTPVSAPDRTGPKGITDVQSEQPQVASKITAAVEVLTEVVERLAQRVEARTTATSVLDADVRDLLIRHDKLRDVVQTHGGRLDLLDEVALEVGQQRWAIRILLLVAPATFALAVLTLIGVAALVAR